MTLICTYTNNKELIEKEDARLEQAQEEDEKDQNIEYLKIRCNILEKEYMNLSVESERHTKEKCILVEVIETLKHEKKRN